MIPDTPIIRKVKNALMSIQRRSWEQSEAMQAMLAVSYTHLTLPTIA